MSQSMKFDEAIQALTDTYTVTRTSQHTGGAHVRPFAPMLDSAEATFRRAAEAADIEGMVDGWNELTDVTAGIMAAQVHIGVFLLASIVNAGEFSAEEVIAALRAVDTSQ